MIKLKMTKRFCRFRSIIFNDMRTDSVLEEHTIRILLRGTLNICAISCLHHKNCRSLNYCRDRLCFLNSEDGFSKPGLFSTSEGCIYAGLQLSTYPSCSNATLKTPKGSMIYCNLGIRL